MDMLFEQQSFTIDGEEPPTKPDLNDLKSEILDFMEQVEYYQKITDPDKRAGKLLTPEAMQYWDHLWNAKGKSLISQEMMVSCANMIHMIRTNGYIMELMGEAYQQSFEGVEKHNEIHLALNECRPGFGIHGVIDNLVIDHAKQDCSYQ